MEILSLVSTIEEAETYIQAQIEKNALESVQYLFEDIETAQKAILTYLQNNPSRKTTPPPANYYLPERNHNAAWIGSGAPERIKTMADIPSGKSPNTNRDI